MNKEYVYLVFYQNRELSVYHEPIEYRCSAKIDHLCLYNEMKRWVEKKLNMDDIIITGFTFLRKDIY